MVTSRGWNTSTSSIGTSRAAAHAWRAPTRPRRRPTRRDRRGPVRAIPGARRTRADEEQRYPGSANDLLRHSAPQRRSRADRVRGSPSQARHHHDHAAGRPLPPPDRPCPRPQPRPGPIAPRGLRPRAIGVARQRASASSVVGTVASIRSASKRALNASAIGIARAAKSEPSRGTTKVRGTEVMASARSIVIPPPWASRPEATRAQGPATR